MDASELRTYEQQLAQVQGALATDSNNEELRNLEAELKNLITLTKQLIEAGASTSSASTSTSASTATVAEANGKKSETNRHTTVNASQAQGLKRYSAGEECQARYEGDGRWYPARIVSVGGSSSDPKYTVLYKGYDSTEIVTSDSLRPLKGSTNITSSHADSSLSAHPAKRPASTPATAKLTPEEEAERERKRRRSEKKAERTANKTAEAKAMQSSWQKFAKKAEKKGTLKTDKSMFKTPDDPLAKVGVVGAGRGMTQYGDRKKHLYDAD